MYETFELSSRYALINKGELSLAIIAALMALLTASGIRARLFRVIRGIR